MLSKKNKEILLGPLSKNNPVIVQILGICSALAVTAKLEPALVMAGSGSDLGGSIGSRRGRICQCHHLVTAKHDTQQYPHHRSISRRRRTGNYRRPNSQSPYVPSEQTALGVRGTYHYQLHPHGSSRSLRSES